MSQFGACAREGGLQMILKYLPIEMKYLRAHYLLIKFHFEHKFNPLEGGGGDRI